MGVLARAWISSLSDGKVKMEKIRKGVIDRVLELPCFSNSFIEIYFLTLSLA